MLISNRPALSALATVTSQTKFIPALCLILVLAIAACSAEISGDQHVANALKFREEGDWPAVIIESKNALRKNPDNMEARLLVAEFYLLDGDWPSAEIEARKALELGAEPNRVMPILAQSWLKQSEHSELESIDLTLISGRALAEVLATQARLAIISGSGDAENLLNQAAGVSPDTPIVLVAEIELLINRGERELAFRKVNALLDKHPDYSLAWGKQGDLYLNKGELDNAREAYTKAIDTGIQDFEYRLKRANVEALRGESDSAQADLTILLKRNPNRAITNYLQGLLLFTQQDFQAAVSAFDKTSTIESIVPETLYYKAASHRMLGELGSAEHLARRFHAARPENLAGRKLLAALLIIDGEYGEAEALLNPVLEDISQDANALWILAEASRELGKTNESIELLAQVLALNPSLNDAQVAFASALLATGRVDEGLANLDMAADLEPSDVNTDVVRVRYYLSNNNPQQALQAAQEAVNRNPDSADALILLGQAQLILSEKEKAQANLRKALELSPGQPLANDLLASMAMLDKDASTARQHYLNTLKYDPENLQATFKLAAIEAALGNDEAAVKLFEQAKETHPTSVLARQALANWALQNNNPEQAIALFAEMGDSVLSRPIVVRILCDAHLRIRQFEKAAKYCELLVEQEPESVSANVLLAKTYGGLNRPKDIKRVIKNVLAIQPDHIGAGIILTKLYISEQNYAGAQEQLLLLNEIDPEHTDVLLLGISLAGDEDKALSLAERAYTLNPSRNPLSAYANALWRTGDEKATLKLLDDWLAENPWDSDIRFEIAQYFEKYGDEKAAIKHYEMLLEQKPNHVIASNNLAWLLREKNPEKALQLALRARRLSPNSPIIMDTLAMVLLNSDRVEDARKVADNAVEVSPNNLVFRYHRAMIIAASGDDATARRELVEILEADTAFPEADDARALLEKLQK